MTVTSNKPAAKKLPIKERYRVLTRDLGWEPSYQKYDDIHPHLNYEGLKVHDWDKWEDPFRLTMDAYPGAFMARVGESGGLT